MNQTAEKKIYAPGNGKLWSNNAEAIRTIVDTCRNAPQGEKVIFKLGFYADEFIEFIKEHKNEKGFININMTARREDGKFGDQFTLWLDTWKPRQDGAQQLRQSAPARAPGPYVPERPTNYSTRPAAPKKSEANPPEEDDVPF